MKIVWTKSDRHLQFFCVFEKNYDDKIKCKLMNRAIISKYIEAVLLSLRYLLSEQLT